MYLNTFLFHSFHTHLREVVVVIPEELKGVPVVDDDHGQRGQECRRGQGKEREGLKREGSSITRE